MKLEGFEEFEKTLNNASKNFNKQSDKALKRVGLKLLREVKKNTPVDTGYLRRSWDIEQKSNYIEIGTNLKYAPHVEFGHRTRGGKGFVEGRYMLTKSVEKVEKSLNDELEIMIENLFK